MIVKDLITYLNSIEDKGQKVYLSNYDFSQTCEAEKSIEIKSSTNKIDYPQGVFLISDI